LNNPLFTVFVVAFYPPKYLPIAVESIMNQTYDNLEIILVNHGAHINTINYINKVSKKDNRVRVVHYEHNLYSDSDPMSIVSPWNKVLEVSTGEYIMQIADDNILSNNYVEKMVKLFQENKECITAAGLVTSIDSQGRAQYDSSTRESNYRSRYMPGHVLILDQLRKGKSPLFSSNGGGSIFAIKRELLVNIGGYHKAVEEAIEFGIVPFGDTGFDDTAVYYWRHHSQQTNKKFSKMGWIGSKERLDMIKEHEIYKRWKVFGTSKANYVVKTIVDNTYKEVAWKFVENLFMFNIKAAFRIYNSVNFQLYATFILIPIFMSIQLKTKIINSLR